MNDTTYTAAWVPFDPASGFDEHSVGLAADWAREQADDLEAARVLVTPTKGQQKLGPEVIRQFASDSLTVTRRSRLAADGQGVVLAYVPDFADMDCAAQCAHGYAMAVVEDPSTPMTGWAMQTGALNLRTGAITPDTRTPGQLALLEDLYAYGNNGWARGFGANQAKRILVDAADRPDRDVIAGYMMARGKHAQAITQLMAIIDRA